MFRSAHKRSKHKKAKGKGKADRESGEEVEKVTQAVALVDDNSHPEETPIKKRKCTQPLSEDKQAKVKKTRKNEDTGLIDMSIYIPGKLNEQRKQFIQSKIAKGVSEKEAKASWEEQRKLILATLSNAEKLRRRFK